MHPLRTRGRFWAVRLSIRAAEVDVSGVSDWVWGRRLERLGLCRVASEIAAVDFSAWVKHVRFRVGDMAYHEVKLANFCVVFQRIFFR
ncbi:hypothetical protein TorRG33x02_161640 [Trema orientale]|uniref:Uncharacterized protein n=1 Tax=Trema orientale TaxID=63057 RepID=A0A2P5ER15_TREOI|nr:hypothetical protein TorRG33x02_161640 [Trema orientale]